MTRSPQIESRKPITPHSIVTGAPGVTAPCPLAPGTAATRARTSPTRHRHPAHGQHRGRQHHLVRPPPAPETPRRAHGALLRPPPASNPGPTPTRPQQRELYRTEVRLTRPAQVPTRRAESKLTSEAVRAHVNGGVPETILEHPQKLPESSGVVSGVLIADLVPPVSTASGRRKGAPLPALPSPTSQ